MTTSNRTPVSGHLDSKQRSFWPIGITIALALVVAINLTMVNIAIRNPSVPAADNHWEASLAFNQEYELRKTSEELGWRLELQDCDLDTSLPRCHLKFSVVDAHGKAISNLQGSLALRRGDNSAFDREVEIQSVPSTSNYEAQFELAALGYYDLELRMDSGSGQWVHFQRVSLGQQNPAP